MLDLVFRNARIVDGSGGKEFSADVSVSGGKIAYIGKAEPGSAAQEIDAAGKVLCPGFVDAHSHSDRTAPFVSDPNAKILQGVTTEVVGNCGQSSAPINDRYFDELLPYIAPSIPPEVPTEWSWRSMKDLLDLLDRKKHITDLVQLAGNGTIRIAAMGAEAREPSQAEMDAMKGYVREAMESGAIGLSSGLIFPPSCYATTSELAELCSVVAEYGGLYSTHIRGEAGSLIEAVAEALEIGRRSGCAVHISHHKVMRRFKGWSEKTLQMMEDAIREGIDVTCDVYPYPAGSNMITSLLPPWINTDGLPGLLRKLRESEVRKRVLEDFGRDLPGWDNHAKDTGWDRVLIGSSNCDKSIVGKSLQEIADERGIDPAINYMDLVVSENAQATIVILSHSEEDMEVILRHRLAMIGSDSLPTSLEGPLARGNPHPRCFGTYPRLLGRYVRDKKLLTLEEAIYKATGFPAARFKLSDRGAVKEGLLADLVVFDPEKIIDKADYRNSRVASEGIDCVVKNGQIVVCEGKTTGKVLGSSVRV